MAPPHYHNDESCNVCSNYNSSKDQIQELDPLLGFKRVFLALNHFSSCALNLRAERRHKICLVLRKQSQSNSSKLSLNISIADIHMPNYEPEATKAFFEKSDTEYVRDVFAFVQQNTTVLFIELNDQIVQLADLKILNSTLSSDITLCNIYLEDNIILSQSHESLGLLILDEPCLSKEIRNYRVVSSKDNHLEQNHSLKLTPFNDLDDSLSFAFYIVSRQMTTTGTLDHNITESPEYLERKFLTQSSFAGQFCKKCNAQLDETRESSAQDTPFNSPSEKESNEFKEDCEEVKDNNTKTKESKITQPVKNRIVFQLPENSNQEIENRINLTNAVDFERERIQTELKYYFEGKRERITRLLASRSCPDNCKKSGNRSLGLVGLKNHGNTCYMYFDFDKSNKTKIRNVCLQSIRHMPLFSDYFLQVFYSKDQNAPHDLSEALANFLILMKLPGCPDIDADISDYTCQIKSLIGETNPEFNNHNQQDALQFLKVLLERISQEVSRVGMIQKVPYESLSADYTDGRLQAKSDKWLYRSLSRENSIITDLFCGQLLNKTKCKNCDEVAITFDTYWDLSLALNKRDNNVHSLSDLFQRFLKEETVFGFECKRCHQHNGEGTFQHFIWRLPEILVIYFKRSDNRNGKFEKRKDYISFPINDLDMKDFVRESEDDSCQDTHYNLFATIDHYGEIEGGHYTAECLNPKNGKWYHYDDSDVRESKIAEQGWHLSSPSILFYIRSSYLKIN